MARSLIVALANQKGGVGKTTTAQNVGAEANDRGWRVLLVDCDPQGSLTSAVGVEPSQLDTTLYTLMSEYGATGDVPDVARALLELPTGEHLLPINLAAADADLEWASTPAKESLLSAILAPIRPHYDLILLDCPPHLGTLTLNALVAATHVLVPVTPEFLSARGLDQLMRTIQMVQKRLNRNLQVVGAVLTQRKGRTRTHQAIGEDIGAYQGGKLRILGNIRDAIAIADAPALGIAVTRWNEGNGGADDYRALTTTLLAALERTA